MQAADADATSVFYTNTIFDDCKAAIDGKGEPMNWTISNCSFTQFFQSEEINKHNDERFHTGTGDKHLCYNPGCTNTSPDCFYGKHCDALPPCDPPVCTGSYVTGWVPCSTGSEIPIYDVGGLSTEIENSIFHKSWKIGSKQSNINLTFPNRDESLGPPAMGGSAGATISIQNNTFATKLDDAEVMATDWNNRGGYARVANNYIESCVWQGEFLSGITNGNVFGYRQGSNVASPAPAPCDFTLQLADATNTPLPTTLNYSSSRNNRFVQYISTNTPIKLNINAASTNQMYLIRPNTNTGAWLQTSFGYQSTGNVYYSGETVSSGSITLPGYNIPGLYGIDVLAFDGTQSTSPPRASRWQHIPIIVNPANSLYLYFNIKDSFKEIPGGWPGATPMQNVYKQVELNDTPIWREDIAEGGDGWEYVAVDLNGNDLTSGHEPILKSLNFNGKSNKLSFSIIIEDGASVSTVDVKGVMVWVDDIYIKRADSPEGQNLIRDGSIELTEQAKFNTSDCTWFRDNAKQFTGCSPLRLISGANGEDQLGEEEFYVDNTRILIPSQGPYAEASITTTDRRSGSQALLLKLPALKNASCGVYGNNDGIPVISAYTEFDVSGLLDCSAYNPQNNLFDFEAFPVAPYASSYDNKKFYLDHNITISSALELQGCAVAIAPGVEIIVDNNGELRLNSFEILPNQYISTTLFGCGPDLWKGIVVEPGGKFIIKPASGGRTIISDAINTLVAQGGAVVKVRYADLINNFNGVTLENGDFWYSNIDDGLLGINFDCPDTLLTKGSIIYSGQRPNVYIKLNNVSGASIGKNHVSYGCTFKNGTTGIFSERSSFSAEGNIFKDLSTGIHYRNGAYLNDSVRIGGDGTSSPNQFKRTAIGIRAYNVCVTCNLNINNNDFDNTGLPEAAATRFYNTAITVQNPVSAFVPGLTPSVHINNNTIDNCRIGIHASNMPEIVIGALTNSSIGYGNNITFNLTQFPLSDFHEGIWLQSCTNAKVVNNSVANSTFTADPNFRGIDIETSPDCDINCNFIDKAGIAVNFYDNCNLTRLRDNTFNQYGTGIMLNGPNGASINADQGGSGDAWDNDWFPLTGFSILKVGGMNLGGLTQINWFHQGVDNSVNPLSPRPWNTTNGNIIVPITTGSGSPVCNDFTKISSNRVRNFGNIIGDSAVFNIDSTASLYQAKLESYLAMCRDSTIISQQDAFDSSFEEFYLSLDTSNVGRMNKVRSMISNNVDSASLLNSLVIPLCEYETLLKSFYEFYFNKVVSEDTLLLADSTYLTNISILPRSTFGEIVHNAAVVIFEEVHPSYSPQRAQSGSELSSTIDLKFSEKVELEVRPNPSSGSISIFASAVMEHIEILNAWGSSIYLANLNSSEKKVDLNGFPPGIYFAKVKIESTFNFVYFKFILL